jgi:hypothetical protein
MKNPILVKFPKLSMLMFGISISLLLIAIATKTNFTLSFTTWSIGTILCFLVYPLDKEVDM